MNEATALERILRRDQWIVGAGLSVICLFALIYLIYGAGTGMSVWDMTTTSLFPHTQNQMAMGSTANSMSGNGMESGAWSLSYAALMIVMWWVMMTAMMTPSAAPMILLQVRVARQAQTKAPNVLTQTAAFTAGYLIVWLSFSVTATFSQWLFELAGIVSASMMWSKAAWLSASLLFVAGIYQWSPWKDNCLRHCQSPAAFLSKHWRPGRTGAIVMGIKHGAYCVGCCWALMALLFVGGVMNLIWIAALAILVLLEKVYARGIVMSRISGTLLIVWGMATLFV